MRLAEKEAKELEMKKRLAEEEREKIRKENLSQKQKTEAMVMNLWFISFHIPFCGSMLYITCFVHTYVLHKAGPAPKSYHMHTSSHLMCRQDITVCM